MIDSENNEPAFEFHCTGIVSDGVGAAAGFEKAGTQKNEQKTEHRTKSKIVSLHFSHRLFIFTPVAGRSFTQGLYNIGRTGSTKMTEHKSQ